MPATVSEWGSSLAVRIPAEIARQLSIEAGSLLDVRLTAIGTIEFLPVGEKARAKRLQDHFAALNERLAEQPMTTPANELLKGEERY